MNALRFAAALALAACGPDLVQPVARERFDPGPVQYAAALHVSNCSGVTVRATDVRWWLADAIEGHPEALGAWNPPGDVYLLPAALDSELVSGHELLHHVLGGDSRHRSPLWASCELEEARWE